MRFQEIKKKIQKKRRKKKRQRKNLRRVKNKRNAFFFGFAFGSCSVYPYLFHSLATFLARTCAAPCALAFASFVVAAFMICRRQRRRLRCLRRKAATINASGFQCCQAFESLQKKVF